jgi:hypothetical protein
MKPFFMRDLERHWERIIVLGFHAEGFIIIDEKSKLKISSLKDLKKYKFDEFVEDVE